MAGQGDDFLILGHKSFGRFEAAGPNVSELKPVDYAALDACAAGAGRTI